MLPMDLPSPALPEPPSHPWPLPPPPPGRRPSGRLRTWIAVGLVLAVVGSAVGGLATSAKSSKHDFRFLRKLPGGAAYRWDPCQPISWSVHLQYAPANALPVVQEAVDRVAQATGIDFIYGGPTDLNIDTYEQRAFMPTDVTRGLWLPILIDWMPHDQFVSRAGTSGALAFGFPVEGQDSDLYTYRSGAVLIDSEQDIPVDFAARFSLGPVVMHELGHVMGLGHVAEGNELMWSPQVPGASQFPDLSETTFGPGDLEGLHELGSGAPCGVVPYSP
jgi:hypothetical protein